MKKPVTVEERRRRKKLILIASAALAAVLLALAVWFAVRAAPDEPSNGANMGAENTPRTRPEESASPKAAPAEETRAPDASQTPGTAAPSAPAAVTEDRSELLTTLKFDAYNRKAYGKMLIRFINNTDAPMYSIPLALKNTRIESVLIGGEAVSFNRADDTLDIPFTVPLARDERCSAFVIFTIDWSDSAADWREVELPRLAYDTTYDIILYVDAANGTVSGFSQAPSSVRQDGALITYFFSAERVHGFGVTLAEG